MAVRQRSRAVDHGSIASDGRLRILEQIRQSSDWVEPRGRGPPPASEAAVDSLPEVEVEVEMVCAVCLEGMRAGEKARRMPSDHIYHGHCIST
ncbi:hypothetical protein QJS10_CPA03g01422 [Acorus calamus]|uniref:RING-type domain-containing protein n=1 Tax=Acorus calamus TaxID=4465 RepID=A0AAV9F5Y3_ACOCL|nr:hypothetical protein QJS10_CPA03g01422 [Acorus calamus]